MRFSASTTLRIAPLIKDVTRLETAPSIYGRLVDGPDMLLGTVFDWQ
jgi:hypothetical protein